MTTQAERIKTLLVERLRAYDSSFDTTEGSGLYSQVIQPVADAMGVDLLDTNALEFLQTRLRQEYPTIPAEIGDAIVDQLIKPLSLLTEALKRELETVKRGQTTRNKDSLTLDQSKDLAANWFIEARGGSRAQTTVRVYYAAPRNVSISSTLVFQTNGGLNFLPLRSEFIRFETVLSQREGVEYYVDVPVIAEKAGSAYSVPEGSITRATGLSGASRITNLVEASPGVDAETASELLDRTEASLVTRTLNVRRGIQARLFEEYPDLRNLEVVGAGDPEMNRDLLTGGGEGDVIASGICLIVGQYCLMASSFESRGLDGLRKAKVGDEVELNYWDFLYGATLQPAERNEDFLIEEILFDTRDAISNLPSILLFRMSGSPTVAPPVAATIPGTYPGVFTVIRSPGTVEISNIPGGILEPNTPRGTVIVDADQIHLYGHYDVWARPTTDSVNTATPELHTKSTVKEGSTLATFIGDGNFDTHMVHLTYELDVSSVAGTFLLGEEVRNGGDAGGTIVKISGTKLSLTGRTRIRNVAVSDTITGGTSGATATVDAITEETLEGLGYADWIDVPYGLTLEILSGPDAGTFKVMQVFQERFLLLDAPMTQSNVDLDYRLITHIQFPLFAPEKQILPFAARTAEDLQTTVGIGLVRTATNLRSLGAVIGDSLEILEGPDAGIYTIQEFDSTYGGLGPVLNTVMSSTNSALQFRVFRPFSAVQPPMVRIPPGGVTLLDPAGQDSGNSVPYGLPVSGRAKKGFSGAKLTKSGLNGFVLSDPGPNWEPTADVTAQASLFAGAETCFSDECVPYDGYIAVATLLNDGSFYVDSGLPAAAVTFLSDIKQWFLDIITAFGIGADATAFVNGLTPIIWDTPPGAGVILAQFEVCLPAEAFNGCNDTFVAIPDIEWDSEFAKVSTFQEALDRYNDVTVDGGTGNPALWSAVAGNTLTIASGANAGSYLIKSVAQYRIAALGSIVLGAYDESMTYPVALVNIEGEFPIKPLSGLVEFFDAGVPTLTVPPAPTFTVNMYDATTGALLTPWEAVEEMLTFIFSWFNAAGFDAPDGLSLDPGETLTTFWSLMFSSYSVGTPACRGEIRTRFTEPTSMTVYAPRACVSYGLGSGNSEAPTLTASDATAALPIAGLGSASWSITVRTLFETTTYNGILPASAGTEANEDSLADIITTDIQETAPSWLVVTWNSGLSRFEIVIRTGNEMVPVGLDFTIAVDADDPADVFTILGFVSVTTVTGTSVPEAPLPGVAKPHAATKFLGAEGAETVEYTVDPDVVSVIYPPSRPSGEVALTDLTRDAFFETVDAAGEVSMVWFNDAGEVTTLFRGIIPGIDQVRVYAQRTLLDVVMPEGPAFASPDRLIGVQTTAGSPRITLPSMGAPQFDFLAPESGLDADEVKVGDLVFVEEGDDENGFVVVSRTATTIDLDRPLTASTPPLYAAGEDGLIDAATDDEAIVVPALPVSTGGTLTEYVGRFVTIWATSRLSYDGSYQITSITDLGATWRLHLSIPVAFPLSESGVHWAVTDASSESLPLSGIGGQTELLAVRPVRIYNGTAEVHTVSYVHPESVFPTFFTVSHPAATVVSTGVKQPYQIIRPGCLTMASSTMSTQGRDKGLYYFDIPALSLGHTDIHNVDRDFRLEPEFGTYDSDGYWFSVNDRNLVFSGSEDTDIVFSSSFLPVEEDGELSAKIALHGRQVSITYEYSPLVDRLQAFLISDSDRIVTANPLARHFLPSYVYLDAVYTGGASRAAVGAAFTEHINSLSPVDALDLSRIERFFQRNDVESYEHPIDLIVVTHDLDRRLVESRSQNRLDDASEDFEGTNRTTYFIAGAVATAEDESDVADGERIFLTRNSGTGSI